MKNNSIPMTSIDLVSKSLIRLALYLDNKVPGIVSEIWIDEATITEIKANLPLQEELPEAIRGVEEAVADIDDVRRKRYLQSILDSLCFQINNVDKKHSFSDFSEKAYGYRINRVSQTELDAIESELQRLESINKSTRFEVFRKYSLPANEYKNHFEKNVQTIKQEMPSFITDFDDKGFIFEVTTDKPWSAFNSHIAPFKSKLTLNSDVSFTMIDLHRLASHEAYGGHHSELSHKDSLLVNEGRGEHGLVITFSPQTFVSESIAEGMYDLLGILDRENTDQMIGWYYDRLIFALQNVATFMYFDDKLTKEQIDKTLSSYGITDKTRQNIINFSTDPLFGKYAPVYYSAFNFIKELYDNTNNKEELIRSVFTKPCTPDLLQDEFRK